MFGPIDRLLHPRSKRELDGVESAGPDPQVRGKRDPELAKALGMNYRPVTEWQGREAEPGEGVIEVSIDDLREMLNRR